VQNDSAKYKNRAHAAPETSKFDQTDNINMAILLCSSVEEMHKTPLFSPENSAALAMPSQTTSTIRASLHPFEIVSKQHWISVSFLHSQNLKLKTFLFEPPIKPFSLTHYLAETI
jgi:hypothetical protein